MSALVCEAAQFRFGGAWGHRKRGLPPLLLPPGPAASVHAHDLRGEPADQLDEVARQVRHSDPRLALVSEAHGDVFERVVDLMPDLRVLHLGPHPRFDDFARLPFTTKAELAADQAEHPPYGTALTFPPDRYCRLHQTSGTSTGRPLRWLDTPESWESLLRCWRISFPFMGLTTRDKVFFPFSFGPFLGFWSAFEAATRAGFLCIPGGGMTSTARLRFLVKVPSVVLANLVLGDNVFPEFIQEACVPEKLADALAGLLEDTPDRCRQLAGLARIPERLRLAGGSPSEAAAEIVLRLAQEGRPTSRP